MLEEKLPAGEQAVKRSWQSDYPTPASERNNTPVLSSASSRKRDEAFTGRMETGIHPKSGTPSRSFPVVPTAGLSSEIRLYTSVDLMWQALTGHGPDLSRVKLLDFECLSVIGRYGSQGILQNHLIAITGQDKRSLPARTDRLHDDGYVVKEHLAIKEGSPPRMVHTSRCVLKRLAKFSADGVLQPHLQWIDPSSAKKKGHRSRDNKYITYSHQNIARDTYTDEKAAFVILGQLLSPQWSAERSINNQIFDLVNQSGTRGLSMSVSDFDSLFRDFSRPY